MLFVWAIFYLWVDVKSYSKIKIKRHKEKGKIKCAADVRSFSYNDFLYHLQ